MLGKLEKYWMKSRRADTCRSWWEELDSTCVRCSMVSSRGPSVPRSCANGCASVPTRRDSAYLHRMLRRLDPEAAKKIHANDKPKLIRALEICLASREQMTEMWKQGRDALQGFRILRLGLNPDRDALYERINERARRYVRGRPGGRDRAPVAERTATPPVRSAHSATNRPSSCYAVR